MKRFLLGLLVVAVAASAQASYLYWQVDTSDAISKIGTAAGHEHYQANLYADSTKIGTATSGYLSSINIDSYVSASSFYIEIVAWDNGGSYATAGTVAVSEHKSYADLIDGGFVTSSLVTVPPAAWTGGTYAAPEPTSAMLMLLGLAGLALKRRKA